MRYVLDRRRLPRPIHPQTELVGIPPDLGLSAAPSATARHSLREARRRLRRAATAGRHLTSMLTLRRRQGSREAIDGALSGSSEARSILDRLAQSQGGGQREGGDGFNAASVTGHARRPPRATPGSASTPNLPPKLPINTSGIKVSFTPDEADPKSEPKRAESARGPARRESKGTPRGSALRDDNAPATARGAGPQRHASPQRPSSARGAAPAP